MDAWYSVTVKDIEAAGGAGLLRQYNCSLKTGILRSNVNKIV
jgi:hypothetical protein